MMVKLPEELMPFWEPFKGRLTYLEKRVLEMRFGLDGSMQYTQIDVAWTLRVSLGRVRSLQKKGIGKLHRAMEKSTKGK